MANFSAHVQGASASAAAGSTSLSVTLGAAPTTGNFVVVGINIGSAASNVLVSDSNGNVYGVTTPNGSGFISPNFVLIYFRNSAPSNASATVTVTWANSGPAEMWVDEFSYPAGFSPRLDQDFVSNNSGTPGTSINSPSPNPTNGGSLVYAVNGSHGNNVTAPAAGGTLGVWTGAGGAIQNGHMAEYALSVTGATAVQFTQSGSATWTCIAAAFFLEVNKHIQLESGTGNVALEAGGAIALE